MRPNLFRFGTSELSQDAFLCWLLSWADDRCKSTNQILHGLGAKFIDAIYSKAKAQPPMQPLNIEIRKQEGGIDILCIVNGESAVLIEDKVGTKQHSDQLPRYKDHVLSLGFSAEKAVPVYIQTGDQSDYGDVEKHGYAVVERRDVLTVLESPEGSAACKGSDIVFDFTSYLRQIENDVRSYATLPVANWSWNSWKGFYAGIQRELADGSWDYVPNASGGFLGFWWHWCGDAHCEQYLQLEQEKFCFKICVPDMPKRSELRGYWHRKIAWEGQKHGLKVKRPGRFGNGKFMTVAILDDDYRITDRRGLLDLGETTSLIHRAEAVLDACVAST
jgi:hypothetical protein